MCASNNPRFGKTAIMWFESFTWLTNITDLEPSGAYLLHIKSDYYNEFLFIHINKVQSIYKESWSQWIDDKSIICTKRWAEHS